MSKFVSWSGIVHATLSSFHPKLRLGQARELLAAALGHNTYASLREHDLQALELSAKCVVLDHHRVLARAAGLGLTLTPDQWWAAHRELTPGRACQGCYIGEDDVMARIARIVFEDTSYPLFHDIARAIGTSDGHWAGQAEGLDGAGLPPDERAFLVHGSVNAFNEEVSLATPVIAEVRFKRVGRQLYSPGWSTKAVQHGSATPYEPDFDGEYYGPVD